MGAGAAPQQDGGRKRRVPTLLETLMLLSSLRFSGGMKGRTFGSLLKLLKKILLPHPNLLPPATQVVMRSYLPMLFRSNAAGWRAAKVHRRREGRQQQQQQQADVA